MNINEHVKSFSELGIESENQLSGKKIGINQVLNKNIKVTDFRIDKSKFPDTANDKRATIQAVVDGEERVIFTNSTILQDQLHKVKAVDGFPFMTTIVPLIPRGYKFT